MGRAGLREKWPGWLSRVAPNRKSMKSAASSMMIRRHHGQMLNDIVILDLETARERFPQAHLVAGIGSPKLGQHVIEKAEAIGSTFETIVHPRVEHSRSVLFGQGAIICAGNILTTNITIGNHVIINLDCTIGHDVIIGDYTTLTPGIHVSGCVHIGQRVYIGTGAIINNGTQQEPLVIGDDAIVGSAACVTKSVPPGLTVVGVPAKPIGHHAEESTRRLDTYGENVKG
jgi:sugar O-acyltransferase (sialic acid O-acetyltransferase NeuD family)